MLLRQKYGFMFLLLFNVACSWPMRQSYNNHIRKLIELIKRRTVVSSSDESVNGVPESEEELPMAEPIHPGHTLLQPSFGMLKSAVKYPQKNDGGAVYGNPENLGITYGKTNDRVLYTGFRKTNNLLYKLLKELPHFQSRPKQGTKSWVVIELDPQSIRKETQERVPYESQELRSINNNAKEILDDDSSDDISSNLRRQRKPRKSKYRDRGHFRSSESVNSEGDPESSDYEQNPGNPYTVYKDKYKQNWLWNHFMDGNHMNVNPYAPPFTNMGPSGAALFFGRKWWYFNQDDFKPLS